MNRAVLDASALLALINGEPGAATVAEVLGQAAISAVNLAETIAKLADIGISADEAEPLLADLGLDVVPFDQAQAFLTGGLRPQTRPRGLSLGDRACLALASSLGVPAMTSDRAWADLDLPVPITVIR